MSPIYSEEKVKSLLENVPQEAWKRLQEQTSEHMQRKKDVEFIKFVCVDRRRFPLAVVFEEHLNVDIRSPVETIKAEINAALGFPESTPIQLHFSGRQLQDKSILSENGVAYPDKVYFYIDTQGQEDPVNFASFDEKGKARWEQIKRWKKQLQLLLEQIQIYPDSYSSIAGFFRAKLCDPSTDESDLWRAILALRNLAGFIEEEVQENAAVEAASDLLDTLKKLDHQEKPYVWMYNIVNVLEWLAYRYPDILARRECDLHYVYMTEVGQKFLNYLIEIIGDEQAPPVLKLEVAWAFSWAGISNLEFSGKSAPAIFDCLSRLGEGYEEVKRALGVALVRSSVIRFVYPDAGSFERLGGFRKSPHYNLLNVSTIFTSDEAAQPEDIAYRVTQLEKVTQAETSTEILYGLATLFATLERHDKAAHLYEKASEVRDEFDRYFRLGQSFYEYSEAGRSMSQRISDLQKAIKFLDQTMGIARKESSEFRETMVSFRKHYFEARLADLKGLMAWYES
jgi:tetratricopeptide (TPR) repeat protein